MNRLNDFTTEELQAELDKREGAEWPRHATIEIDYPWDDVDTDCVAEQLGWDKYNEDYRAEKFRELDLPSCINITIAVQRNGSAEIVAVNGKKISDETFGVEPVNKV